MITMGISTIAVVTWGLGISVPYLGLGTRRARPDITFRDRPERVAIEDNQARFRETTPSVGFRDRTPEVKFNDKG